MDTKILKLTNGDEIITTMKLDNDMKGIITLENPLKINIYPKMSKRGVEESMALTRWVSYGENDTCDIVASNIIAVSNASLGIAKFYEFCVLKMKNGKMVKHLGVHEPTDEQLKEIEDELLDELDDDMVSKTIH
jgi:hypothetical protein